MQLPEDDLDLRQGSMQRQQRLCRTYLRGQGHVSYHCRLDRVEE